MPFSLATLPQLPAQSDVFMGIDISIGSWHVSLRCHQETLFGASLPPKTDSLQPLLNRLQGCRIHSVYEAAGFGYGLHDWLAAHGVNSIVVSPAQVPVEVGNRIKTDRRDSLKLASTLEAGLLRPIFIPEPSRRAHRELVRQRGKLQRHRRSSMVRLKSLFLSYSIVSPFRRTSHWTGPYHQWLRELTVEDPVLQIVLTQARDLYFDLNDRLKALDADLRRMAVSTNYAASTSIFTTIPGIGKLNALILAVEVIDWTRFRDGEAFSAFVGLTPSEYSSGDRIQRGSITRAGNCFLRTMLVEAAWVFIRKDRKMRRFYEQVRQRRGAKRAIVAVARKMCHVLVAMAKTGEVYRTSRMID
jgi:transposase